MDSVETIALEKGKRGVANAYALITKDRVVVARVYSREDADSIATAVNNHRYLVDALQQLTDSIFNGEASHVSEEYKNARTLLNSIWKTP